MTRRVPRSRVMVALAGFAAVALLTAGLVRGADPTDAAWTSPQMASGTVSALTLAPPTGLACVTSGGGLLGTNTATLTWPTVIGVTEYVLEGKGSGQTDWTLVSRTGANTFVFESSLLGGLLGSLLNTLFGTGTVQFRVRSVVGDHWISSTATGQHGVRTTTLLEGLGGYRCVP